MSKVLNLTDFESDIWDEGIPTEEGEIANRLYLKQSTFPSGFEEHVQVVGDVMGESVQITASFRSSADVMRLLLVTDALRRAGAARISLFMTFLPYGRQDRICAPGEALSARVFADLINAQKYHTVSSVHSHSDVLPAMLNNYLEFRVLRHYERALQDYPEAVILSPDAGAAKKVEVIAQMIKYTGEIAYAHKSRNGGVMEILYIHGPIMREKDVIIVDDICDGGATFIALAQKLKEDYKASKVILAVTHGIFSRGPKHLLDNGIDAIYTTNTVVHPACAGQEDLINRSSLNNPSNEQE